MTIFTKKAILGVAMIMVGCCLNVVSLEFITKYVFDTVPSPIHYLPGMWSLGVRLGSGCVCVPFRSAPGAGWLLTFLQFLLVTALGFFSYAQRTCTALMCSCCASHSVTVFVWQVLSMPHVGRGGSAVLPVQAHGDPRPALSAAGFHFFPALCH